MRSASSLAAVILSAAAAAAAPVSALPLEDLLELNLSNVPREPWPSPTQISEMLAMKGYTVVDIEIDDEVDLIDTNGTQIEGRVYVYPATEHFPDRR
jgi:hypothetical protein